MRVARLTSALAVLVAVAALAACGGGGGSSTPTVPPASNAPPGGPPPATPTPGSTASPGMSPPPTPIPTQSTPPPTPTPVTTTPPPTPTPVPTPSPTTTPFAYSWQRAGGGSINGTLNNQFTTSAKNINRDPYDGDLKPGDPGALPQGGGQGPAGNTVDGISCDVSMSNVYHVHAFIGLWVNGQQVVIPDAIGIVNPHGEFTDSDGWPNQEIYGDCFYHVHTHDESGLLHMEDPDPSGTPITGSLFTVGNMFDIWGLNVTATNFGPFSGPVTVYTSGQFSRNAAECYDHVSCEVGSTNYTQWTGDPSGRDIPLYSHEVIWYEVGTGNPAPIRLPGINFDVKQ